MISKQLYQRRKDNKLCTDCGRPTERLGNRCNVCKAKDAACKKSWYARKKISGICLKCFEKATVKMYCRKHWFHIISKANFGTIKYSQILEELLEKQKYRCALTGRLLVPGVNASIDHIIPCSKGGSDDITNLQWVDTHVNYAKSDLSMDEFKQLIQELVNYTS